MRNKNRIQKFCDELAKVWATCPDMRFGQMISNIQFSLGERDIFFIEEKEFMDIIKQYFGYEEEA